MALVNGVDGQKPHIVLIPFMAQGHMIPMTDMARLLAERGAIVTFVTTPVNASRIKSIIDRVHLSGLPLRFVELPFPCADVGLPLGCENLDLISAKEDYPKFCKAADLLRRPFEQCLRELVPRPSCMIADMGNPWTAEVGRRLNMLRLVFHGPSCFYILCSLLLHQHKIYEKFTDDFEALPVPGMPQPIHVSKAHAPGWFNVFGFQNWRAEALQAEETADGVVINTFDDLEPMFLETYRKVAGKKVWTVGPLCLYDKDFATKSARGNLAAVEQHRLFSWLDSMEPNSVLYVSFGSLTHTKASQLVELGLGLEASGKPFIWGIKEVQKSPEMKRWLADGFEERTKSRSFIIQGWAPQVTILSHQAIGGFLTHCGWNSALEAMSAGVPMITWPNFADQFLSERLIVEFMRIGIAIGAKKPFYYMGEDEIEITRDDVEKAVRDLMDDGEQADERRARAREMKEKALKAMEAGGSSSENITSLIEYTKQHQEKDVHFKEQSECCSLDCHV